MGIFHDIGKIGTADDILLKTDKLSAAEFEQIKQHPIKGGDDSLGGEHVPGHGAHCAPPP